jgi:hypothetical protein
LTPTTNLLRAFDSCLVIDLPLIISLDRAFIGFLSRYFIRLAAMLAPWWLERHLTYSTHPVARSLGIDNRSLDCAPRDQLFDIFRLCPQQLEWFEWHPTCK